MQQEEIGLQHYVEMFWRRKWGIGVVFLIVFTLAILGIVLTKPTFKAQSKVVVKSQMYYRSPVLSFSQGTDAPTTTMSPEAYEGVINGLPFAEKVGDYLLADGLPLDPLEIHAALKAEYQEPDLIFITATSKRSDYAVRLANAAASVFEEYTKDIMRGALNDGRDEAVVRQTKAREEAEALQAQISAFRREMGFIDISGEMATLREKTARFEQARGDIITKLEIAQAHRQELLNLAKAGATGQLHLDDPRIEEYRKLQQTVAEARVRYTDNHPALRNMLDQIEAIEGRLRATIARSGSKLTPEAFLTLKEDLAKTEAEISDLETAINSWDGQIAAVRQQLQGYPEKLAHLETLQTREASAMENYKTWTNRIDETEFKGNIVPPSGQIVEVAIVAGATISKATSLVLALIVSTLLALGTGFLTEFADTTLRSPEEIPGTIGLPYLGSIIKLKEQRQVVFADGKPTSQVAEAYSRVYSNIKFAEVDNAFRSILVTSARKGEGKSTTLVNIACSIAAAGKRVIIVDTDLRNPTLQRVLGLRHAAGVTSVLAGEAILDDVLKPTGHPGLTILPAGPIPPNPAEMLHSNAMKHLIRDLEQKADLVIFDSPPALLVADAMLLAGELDAAVIVAESGGVTRKAVMQVKESLQIAKARILGVVLNKVQESAGAYYNYYSYYKYYREGESDQPQTAMSRLKSGLGNIRRSMGGRS